jgi:hypothetical protein
MFVTTCTANISDHCLWDAGLQLTAPGESVWSAAAWVGVTRDAAGQWSDASGPLSNLPWCPYEPNNNSKDGEEACSNLLTGCANTGEALLNDFACHKPARVVCSFDSSDCGGSGLAGADAKSCNESCSICQPVKGGPTECM